MSMSGQALLVLSTLTGISFYVCAIIYLIFKIISCICYHFVGIKIKKLIKTKVNIKSLTEMTQTDDLEI